MLPIWPHLFFAFWQGRHLLDLSCQSIGEGPLPSLCVCSGVRDAVGGAWCRYLNIPNIVAAAMSLNCTMLHPGYGFLAENATFADICLDHGLNFIGPKVSGSVARLLESATVPRI
jgi:hypothetical protein